MLPGMVQERQRFTVNVEVTVEVTDPAALTQAAMHVVETSMFAPEPRRSREQVVAAARDEVRTDLSAALEWVVEPDAILTTDEGLQFVGSTQSIAEVDLNGVNGTSDQPDFAKLFSVCRCARDDCDACSGFQLTPRTAVALWTVGQLLADQVYDDIAEHGDDPVSDDGGWNLLASYPRLTWRADAVWRRQAARAFDDLTDDLHAGHHPSPTCPGEEMALHLMLQMAEAAITDGWGVTPDDLDHLPEHSDDFAWDLALDVLLQDNDILNLFDERMDGIEDPDTDDNRTSGMGDYRPAAWFRPFRNATPRDGRRGFRR
jgi:hypothetical protein